MKHSSRDLLVYSNGTLRHSVTINAEVNCEVNMFNYPFAADACPVAIQTWALDGEFSNQSPCADFYFLTIIKYCDLPLYCYILYTNIVVSYTAIF